MINWRVKLANNDTFMEGEEPFAVIEGEKSPWLRLKDYLAEKQTQIIYLALVVDGKVYSLPSKYYQPKFSDFANSDKPAEYNFFRKLGSDLDGSTKSDYFAVIEASYGEMKLQLWVDEYTKNCWCIIK